MTEIKKQVYGVEVEMVGIGNKGGAKVIAKYFGTEAYFEGGHYDKWCAKDRQGRVWTCMNDGSLTGSDWNNTEMVTPILGWDDMDDLQEVVRALRKAGGRADDSCGIHVHVGADEHTPATLKNLLNLVYVRYELLEKALNFTARKYWCKKANTTFMADINRVKPNSDDKLAEYWYGTGSGNGMASYCGKVSHSDAEWKKSRHYDESRYQLVNLHSYFQGKGVEFRAFNGTMHAGEIKAYVQFCCALNAKAINMSKSSMKDLDNNRSDKHEMKHWLKLLGMNGKDAEFKTCRQHMTKNLAD